MQHIRDIFEEGRQTYGNDCIQGILAEQGIRSGRERVARLMQANGLKPKTRRSFRVITTDSKHKLPVALNCLEQDFTADAADQKWTADTLAPARSAGITYIPAAEGWLCLPIVLDLYSRRSVGWAMNDSLHRQLVIDALHMALAARKPAPGLVHHSDRGSQYASHDYQALLTRAKMISTLRVSRKGNCTPPTRRQGPISLNTSRFFRVCPSFWV